MSKRKRFIITSSALTFLLIIINIVTEFESIAGYEVTFEWRYYLIGVLTVVSGLLTAWSLRDGWRGMTRIMTILLPMLFSLGSGMFTFLLPNVIPGIWGFQWGAEVGVWVSWVLRSLFWLFYLISFYSLLLTENIFSVSAIRTIALVRAASAVGFLLTLISGFFLYNALWSFRLEYYWNALMTFLISMPLILQGLWSVKLDTSLSKEMVIASIGLSVLIAEVALVLSFWPVSVVVGSLSMTTLLYVMLGLYQQSLMRRLFKKTFWEYMGVGWLVFIIVLTTTKWGM